MNDNFIYDLLLNMFIAIGTGIAVSEIYWQRRIMIDRPRIYAVSYDPAHDNSSPWNTERTNFNLENKGLTRAVDISIKDRHTSRSIGVLEPNGTIFINTLAVGIKQHIDVSYKDMFGKSYTESWTLHGPYFEELDEESGGLTMQGYSEPQA